MTIGEAIKKRLLFYIAERKTNITKLSLDCGITPSTIFEFMYNKTKVLGITTIARLCEGLNITLSEFFDTDYFKNLDLPE